MTRNKGWAGRKIDGGTDQIGRPIAYQPIFKGYGWISGVVDTP